MARPDLTNEQIEQMGRDNPGSAAEYLGLRREELEAERQTERERDDYARFERAFVEAGGTKAAARDAHARRRNEEAERTATAADADAAERTRRAIARGL